MSETRRSRWEREHPVEVIWLPEPRRLLPGGRGPRVLGVCADADPELLHEYGAPAPDVSTF